MPVSPIDTFNFASKRADHFLTLYDILHDSRKRKTWDSWMDKFKSLMNWNKKDNYIRIDGKDGKSILILSDNYGIDREHFSHEYVSELLRSSVVCIISALDRYVHDVIVEKCWTLLSLQEEEIPKELKKLKIPALVAKSAILKIKREPKSRPGTIVKKAIQDSLHLEYTFQNKSSMDKAAQILGIKDFWNTIAKHMEKSQRPVELQSTLTKICKRRNQIVHECDIKLKISAREISSIDITHVEAIDYVSWIKDFVKALDRTFNG